MKNVKLFVMFIMVASFTEMNASWWGEAKPVETAQDKCTRLKKDLVQGILAVYGNKEDIDRLLPRDGQGSARQSLYAEAFSACGDASQTKNRAYWTYQYQGMPFREEILGDVNRAMKDFQAKQINSEKEKAIQEKIQNKLRCDEIRKQFAAALSVSTNDVAVQCIIDAYASDLAGCK